MIRRGRNLPLAAWAAIGGTATVVTIVVLVGAVLISILLVRVHGRVEGYKLSLVLIALFALLSVAR